MLLLALLAAAAPPAPALTPGPPPLPLRPAAPNAPPPPDLKLVSAPDPARFFPKAERNAGASGTVTVQLILRYDGSVSQCQVVNGSGWRGLNAAACPLAEKLRFGHFMFRGEDMAIRTPATEFGCCARVEIAWADGTARVRRTDVQRPARLVNRREIFADLEYPAAALRAHEEGSTAADLDIAADGRVTGCTIVSSSGSATLDAETCRLALLRARAQAAVGPDGEPVPGTDRVRIRWTIAPEPTPAPAAGSPVPAPPKP
jgi:TonB family protein